jgi:hypothetical protein
MVAATDFIHDDRRPSDEETLSKVKEIVSLLGDQHCEWRERAIFQKFPLLPTVLDDAFLKETASSSNNLQRKVTDLLAAREQHKKVAQEFEKLLQELIFPALKKFATEDADLLTQSKVTLLQIARSQTTPVPKRQAAIGSMYFFVDQYSDPEGMLEKQGLPVSQWKRALVDLLSSDDSFLRTEVAGSIGVSNKFRDVERALIIPILLSALRNNDLSTRILTQKALVKLTGEKFCVDPTDLNEDREGGIRKWEYWWEGTKAP